MATIQIPFKEAIGLALQKYREKNPAINTTKIKYMKIHDRDEDSECYEIPDYIELQIDL